MNILEIAHKSVAMTAASFVGYFCDEANKIFFL
jgi:hypothetical protein